MKKTESLLFDTRLVKIPDVLTKTSMNQFHHPLLAIVGLQYRYNLSKELTQRNLTQRNLNADGTQTKRHFTNKSSFGQSILTFARFTCTILIACCAMTSFINGTTSPSVLFTDIGSIGNRQALSSVIIATSWLVISALLIEQYMSKLPLGRSVRGVSVLVAAVESRNMVSTTLQTALICGFAVLCLVCQYAGEYRHVINSSTSTSTATTTSTSEIKSKVKHIIRKATKSLRIVFLTIGTRGDVQPFVALGRALLKAGHRPVITTHKNFQKFIEDNGIEFQYCGTEMDQPGLLGKAATGSNVYAWFREALKKITEPLYMTVNTHMYESCINCDMIVSTGHTVGQAMDFAEKLQCLHWCCRLTPHEWFTRSFGAHSQRGSSCCGCINLFHHYKYWGDVGRAYGEANIASLQHTFRNGK